MRIIAFGCSLTYGHGLEDCVDKNNNPGPKPSKFAWPQVLANNLGTECINCSAPGASNKLILYNLQNFTFEKNDFVVCLWTHRNRHHIFKKTEHKYIGLWIKEKYCKQYYKSIYDDFDSIHDLYTRANWAKNYLDVVGIKNIHLSVKHSDLTDDFIWNRVNFLPLYMNVIRKKFPKALDNHHPGLEAHKYFASQIQELINYRGLEK